MKICNALKLGTILRGVTVQIHLFNLIHPIPVKNIQIYSETNATTSVMKISSLRRRRLSKILLTTYVQSPHILLFALLQIRGQRH